MDIKSEILLRIPGIIHGFGTKTDPTPSCVLPFWEQADLKWEQVHGTETARVEQKHQNCGKVDALYTFMPEFPVAVKTADCVPVLLAHKKGRAVAAIHAGWRGVYSHIVKKSWQHLEAAGEDPQNWVAVVGPAIGPCCYEVSEELAGDFLKEFESLESEIVSPQFRRLDLPSIQAAELKKMGFSEIEVIRKCTCCSVSPFFSSFRRDRGVDRQYSVVMKL